jgi:hypothetical protein
MRLTKKLTSVLQGKFTPPPYCPVLRSFLYWPHAWRLIRIILRENNGQLEGPVLEGRFMWAKYNSIPQHYVVVTGRSTHTWTDRIKSDERASCGLNNGTHSLYTKTYLAPNPLPLSFHSISLLSSSQCSGSVTSWHGSGPRSNGSGSCSFR